MFRRILASFSFALALAAGGAGGGGGGGGAGGAGCPESKEFDRLISIRFLVRSGIEA